MPSRIDKVNDSDWDRSQSFALSSSSVFVKSITFELPVTVFSQVFSLFELLLSVSLSLNIIVELLGSTFSQTTLLSLISSFDLKIEH